LRTFQGEDDDPRDADGPDEGKAVVVGTSRAEEAGLKPASIRQAQGRLYER